MKSIFLQFKRRVLDLLDISEEEPHILVTEARALWSSSDSEDVIKDLSHWRRHGRWTSENSWISIGDKHWRLFNELLRFSNRDNRSYSVALEWGPGGGPNACVFLKSLQRYYGVDISKANLKECAKQVQDEKLTGFIPVLFDAHSPESVMQEVTEGIDLFLSTAVYQHFPSKEYGSRVTKIAYKMLKEHGLAIIQIRYDDSSKKYRAKKRNYKKNATFFMSYPIHEFWNICKVEGFTPLYLTLEPEINYAYYFLAK